MSRRVIDPRWAEIHLLAREQRADDTSRKVRVKRPSVSFGHLPGIRVIDYKAAGYDPRQSNAPVLCTSYLFISLRSNHR